MTKRYILDANIIVRILTNDPPKEAEAAKALLQRAIDGEIELELTELCCSEIVWVMQSFYKSPRNEIIKHLQALVSTPGIYFSHRKIFEDALGRFASHNIDIADAFHAALAFEKDLPVVSFDNDFDRFKDITRIKQV